VCELTTTTRSLVDSDVPGHSDELGSKITLGGRTVKKSVPFTRSYYYSLYMFGCSSYGTFGVREII
jgi:hypothetical protein